VANLLRFSYHRPPLVVQSSLEARAAFLPDRKERRREVEPRAVQPQKRVYAELHSCLWL
jgi:hypothetical protein